MFENQQNNEQRKPNWVIYIAIMIFLGIIGIPIVMQLMAPTIRNVFCTPMSFYGYDGVKEQIKGYITDKNKDESMVLEVQLGMRPLSPDSGEYDEPCCFEYLRKAYGSALRNQKFKAKFYLWYSDIYVQFHNCD